MGIELRVAESGADLEAWHRARLAVLPKERALSVAEMRAMMTAESLYLIAELDGELAGSGLGGHARLGFRYGGESITVRGRLPLERA